jgi:hypothetical protein
MRSEPLRNARGNRRRHRSLDEALSSKCAIGALAVALGIGAATSLGFGAAPAGADTGTEPSDSSASNPSPDNSSSGAPAAAATSGTVESSAPPDADTDSDADSGSDTDDPRSTVPEMNFESTGGAHTADDAREDDEEPTSGDDVIEDDALTTQLEPDLRTNARTIGSSTRSDESTTIAEPTFQQSPASIIESDDIARDAADRPLGGVGDEHPVEGTVVPVATTTGIVGTPVAESQSAAEDVTMSMLASVFSPFLMPGPDVPTQSPLVLAMYAWSRRESETSAMVSAAGREQIPAPVIAAADAYVVVPDTKLVVDAKTGLLANDFNPDGRKLTASVVGEPRSGSLAVNADGSFEYTPRKGFQGTDTFSYQVTDGVNTAEATVRVVVTSSVLAAADDWGITYQDNPIRVNVLANDQILKVDRVVVQLATKPVNGKVEFTPEGVLTYVPNPGFTGTETFTYTVTDEGKNTSTGTVTIRVLSKDSQPVAKDDETSTPANTPVTIDVLANDYDPDGGPLTVQIVTGPGYGKVKVGADGQLVYTPHPGFIGRDVVTYLVTDSSGQSSKATVTIDVREVKIAPKAHNDSYATQANSVLTIATAAGILVNDIWSNDNGLTVSLDEITKHGALFVNSDGSFTYVPNPGYVGTDTFTYRAFDGRVASEPVTVTITVAGALGSDDGGLGCTQTYLPEAGAPSSVTTLLCLLPAATKSST